MNKLLSYFKAYSIFRWIRLAAGILLVAEAFRTEEFIVSLIGFALIFMALTSASCSPFGNSCAKPIN